MDHESKRALSGLTMVWVGSTVTAMSVVRHTPESLARWHEADMHDPARAKLRELTVAYVTAQGGLMEDVWRLYMGPWFGEPEMMLLSEVAERLGISEWHAENI